MEQGEALPSCSCRCCCCPGPCPAKKTGQKQKLVTLAPSICHFCIYPPHSCPAPMAIHPVQIDPAPPNRPLTDTLSCPLAGPKHIAMQCTMHCLFLKSIFTTRDICPTLRGKTGCPLPRPAEIDKTLGGYGTKLTADSNVEAIMEPFRSPAGDRTWVL